MKKLYDLKDKLLDSLMEYAALTKFSSNDVATVKNLISSILKICEYAEMEEGGEYSGARNRSYRGNSYGNSYDDMSYNDRSYADRRGRGRYAERDARGRYSSDGYSRHDEDMVEKLHSMMDDAPAELRQDMQRLISKMENM